jgi:predicted phage tail protein
MLDFEQLLREGKTLEEIANLVSKELNDAQSRIDEEDQKAKEENEKKEAIYNARKEVVAAFKHYLSLVSGTEIKDEVIDAALEDIELSINLLKNAKISRDGHPFDLFSILFR